jgi:GWxTD domain-containing protein
VRTIQTAFLLLFSLALPAQTAPDPVASVNAAKAAISAGRPAEALPLLRGALPVAAASTNLRQRAAGLSAIYFYTALAESALGQKEEAAADLQSFLLYSPSTKLNPSQFPAEFTALFEKVSHDFSKRRGAPASFGDAYPGFPPGVSSSVWPVDLWGASSEFVILGTTQEKEQWGHLKDTAERQAFIDNFWSRRDPDPSTSVNEMRVEILSRIAFADVSFVESADDRGSLSDRGRIFVLLGPPKDVSIRPMNRAEAWYQPPTMDSAGNAMEQWTYFREQLPKALPKGELVVRFISDGGSLVRRREKDMMSEKALKDAPAALLR